MSELLRRNVGWIAVGIRGEKLVLLGLLVTVVFLAFFNLEYNPRTWHDEGAALLVAKTLVVDGVYAMRNLNEFQTFGPIQSVGPTVLVPIALSFKLFGISLVHGRIVAAVYLLLTIAMFYLVGRELFEWRTALVATALLVGSEAVRLFVVGRQVLGEVPALGFFLGGLLIWSRSVRARRNSLSFLAGLLIGAAMVTKSYYIAMVFGAIALLAILDMFYYRQRNLMNLIILSAGACLCLAAWTGWQFVYFGAVSFQENAALSSELAVASSGFHSQLTAKALAFLFGTDSGHFYYFWGFPALLYAVFLSVKRNQDGFILGFLTIFTCLWLAFWAFWFLPINHYALAPAAICAFFVGKLWYDLTHGFSVSWSTLWTELRQSGPGVASLRLVALATLAIMIGCSLQGRVKADLLEKYDSPQFVAAYLNQNVNRGDIIETWERELTILTDHVYHSPDQSILAQVHQATYSGNILGASYFQKYRPSYLIVGWFARNGAGTYNAYDMDFVLKHGSLVATIDDYDIYKLRLCDSEECP